MTSSRKRRPARGSRARTRTEREARALAPCQSRARRRGRPAPRLVLALEHARHPVRPADRTQGRRAAQLLHGLDRPRARSRRTAATPSPRQQSEADFYGEDRAELITINKILVALDLIEIRKEMVLRADPAGPALEGAAQLLPGQGPRRRLHPLSRRRAARRRAGRPRPRRLPLRAARLLAALLTDRRRQCLGTDPARGTSTAGLAATGRAGPPPRRIAPPPAPGPVTPHGADAATETDRALDPTPAAAIFCARCR